MIFANSHLNKTKKQLLTRGRHLAPAFVALALSRGAYSYSTAGRIGNEIRYADEICPWQMKSPHGIAVL